jgi:hypothetical protein
MFCTGLGLFFAKFLLTGLCTGMRGGGVIHE